MHITQVAQHNSGTYPGFSERGGCLLNENLMVTIIAVFLVELQPPYPSPKSASGYSRAR